MKAQSILRAAVAAAALLQGTVATQAATLYWDADATAAGNNVDGTNLGGAGTWSTANTWWNGIDANQNWANNNTAVFNHLAGSYTVTMGAAVTADALQFGNTGVTINMNNYNLTVGGLSGSFATINQTVASDKVLTLNIASGVNTWSGRIEGRFSVTKSGAGTFELSGASSYIGNTYTYNTLAINNGTFRLVGGADCNFSGGSGGYIIVANGAVFDVGTSANVRARYVESAYGSTITGSSGGLITDNNGNSDSRAYGKLTGSVGIQLSNSGTLYIMGAISDQSGDTRLSGNNVWPTVIAAANASLGTGRVRIQKTGTGTATLILRAPAPVLGSLESAGSSGTRAVTLGNTGVTLVSGALKATWTSGSSLLTVTTGSADSLSVGQVISSAAGNGIPDGATIVAIRSGTQFEISANTTVSKTATSIGAAPVNTTVSVGSLNRDGDVFDVAIGQASGTVGSLTKVGTGAWTLSGASTYTGTTRVEAGKITLTGSLGSGKVQVAGGTFEGGASGSRTATFNLGSAPDGMVLTSGALDISKINLSFAGAADLTSYTLVDYSAGGTLTTATGVPATENTFASAANVPAGYKWLHDTSAKKVLLFLPPAVTVITIR